MMFVSLNSTMTGVNIEPVTADLSRVHRRFVVGGVLLNLLFCVVFCRFLLVFLSFSFGQCIVCSSFIDGF
jgi:hypothetical protein